MIETRGETLNKGIGAKHRTFTSGYRNNRCVWILPTRGMIPLKVHVSLRNTAWLMNTPRACIEIERAEVGEAYNEGFTRALESPEALQFPFVWTYEEDNVQPMDVFHKLFDAIWHCIDCGVPMPSNDFGSPAEEWICQNGHTGLDAVGGLYFTKTIPSEPMAYGDPKSPELEMRPRDVREASEKGALMEVNGVAMGSTLWRKDLFRKVSKPWFRTMCGGEPERAGAHTQDLYFCRKAKEEAGARFAVHCGVQVGHIDVESGVIY